MDHIIDCHTHYIPEVYRKALAKHVPGNPDGWPTPKWQPRTTLDFMHKHGVGYSVLSLSSPHINFGDRDETISLARDVNTYGAQLHREHPDELGYAASLPLPYPEAAVAEIDHALVNEAQAFAVPTNTRGIYWGTPIFDPVYAKLNEEHAVVMLHPNQPSQQPLNVDIDLPTPLMGFFFDTTMVFMNLLRYHFFDRYPDIKMIFPHGGAFMPILADRDAAFVHAQYQADMYAAMRHVYFDTAGAVLPRQLPMLLTLAGREHIVYGSDIPYTGTQLAGQLLSVLKDGGTAASAKKYQRVATVERHAGILKNVHATREVPFMLSMMDKMLAGSDILTPDLKRQILVDNATALFA